MLLLAIFALVIVVGIVFCTVIAHRSYWDDEAWAFLGGLLITLGAIGLIGGGIAAIVIESEESIVYENAIAEYDMLQYRLEHQENDATLYSDIVQFNERMRTNARWAKNPFVNIWNYQRCADIPLIEIKEGT